MLISARKSETVGPREDGQSWTEQSRAEPDRATGFGLGQRKPGPHSDEEPWPNSSIEPGGKTGLNADRRGHSVEFTVQTTTDTFNGMKTTERRAIKGTHTDFICLCRFKNYSPGSCTKAHLHGRITLALVCNNILDFLYARGAKYNWTLSSAQAALNSSSLVAFDESSDFNDPLTFPLVPPWGQVSI